MDIYIYVFVYCTQTMRNDDGIGIDPSPSATITGSMSFHSILSIPMNFVLQPNRPILRQDAISFIRVTLLSSEMDVLIHLIIQELERRRLLREHLSFEQYSRDNPLKYFVRAALPLVSSKIEHCSNSIQRLQSSVQNCLTQLMQIREQLAQCSEQNLSIAEQLAMYDTGNVGLSVEKRIIGEVQEALVARIDAVLQVMFTSSDDEEDNSDDQLPIEQYTKSMVQLISEIDKNARNVIDDKDEMETSIDMPNQIGSKRTSDFLQSTEVNQNKIAKISIENRNVENDVRSSYCLIDESVDQSHAGMLLKDTQTNPQCSKGDSNSNSKILPEACNASVSEINEKRNVSENKVITTSLDSDEYDKRTSSVSADSKTINLKSDNDEKQDDEAIEFPMKSIPEVDEGNYISDRGQTYILSSPGKIVATRRDQIDIEFREISQPSSQANDVTNETSQFLLKRKLTDNTSGSVDSALLKRKGEERPQTQEVDSRLS